MESRDSRREAALVYAETLVFLSAVASVIWWMLSLPLGVYLMVSGSRATIPSVLGTMLVGGVPAWFAGRAVAQGIRMNVVNTPELYAFKMSYKTAPSGEALAAVMKSLLPWTSEQAIYGPALRSGFSLEECRRFGRWWLTSDISPVAGLAWTVVFVIWLAAVAGLLIHLPHELKAVAFATPVAILPTSVLFYWHVRDAPLIESALAVPIERVMGEAGYRKIIGHIYWGR